MVSERRFGATGPASSRGKRGLVLGCGGTLGAAWMVAALHEVSRALAWDPRSAEVIVGTSSGSEIAALLGCGVSVEALLDGELALKNAQPALARRFASPPASFPPLPRWRFGSAALARRAFAHPSLLHLAAWLPDGRGDLGFVSSLIDETLGATVGWAPHPATWIMGVDFDSGERVAFGSKGAPKAHLRDAVRASWAIPGWYPPVAIDGRRFVDGGLVSPSSADLLAPFDFSEVVVIAPMSSRDVGPGTGLARAERLVRASMRRTLDAEVALLRKRGTRVVLIEPQKDDLEVMGANFMDRRLRLRVLEWSLRSCRRTVARALESAPPARKASFQEQGVS